MSKQLVRSAYKLEGRVGKFDYPSHTFLADNALDALVTLIDKKWVPAHATEVVLTRIAQAVEE